MGEYIPKKISKESLDIVDFDLDYELIIAKLDDTTKSWVEQCGINLREEDLCIEYHHDLDLYLESILGKDPFIGNKYIVYINGWNSKPVIMTSVFHSENNFEPDKPIYMEEALLDNIEHILNRQTTDFESVYAPDKWPSVQYVRFDDSYYFLTGHALLPEELENKINEIHKKMSDITIFYDNNLSRISDFSSPAEAMCFILQNGMENSKELVISAINYHGNVMEYFDLQTEEERLEYIKTHSKAYKSIQDMVSDIRKKLNQ
jgi:hypothetical protein